MPRTIEWTTAFGRDRKRELKGRFGPQLEQLLTPVIRALAADEPLEPKHRDHAMTAEWKDCRDCHVRPILCSSIGSWVTTFCSSYGSGHTVSWGHRNPRSLVAQ